MSLSFVVEMDVLKQHINFVRSGLGSTKTDLSALLFRFEVKGNRVTIFAADKEMFCRTEMTVRREEAGESDGVFAVLGSKMEDLVSQVAAEKVEFLADQENLEVQAGFLTVNFETFDSTPLRTVEVGVEEHLTIPNQSVLRELLTEALACAKACSTTDSLRPDVNHSELRNGRLLASDGRKIMIFTPEGFEKGVLLKVPNSSLSSVVTSLKNIDTESVTIAEGKAYYYIKSAGNNRFSLGVRKVERSFPAVEGQILGINESDDEISVDKNVLVQMCKGVSLGLSGDEVRVELSMRGAGREAVLEIEGVNKLGRRSHESSSCGRRAEETITIPISFKHILDTLGVFKGDSVVDMVVVQKRNVLLVRDRTNAREVLTVIPFRTSKQIEEEKKEVENKEKASKPAPKGVVAAAPARVEESLENQAVLE